jgi:hypothetical protein
MFFTDKSVKDARKRIIAFNKRNPDKKLNPNSIKLVGKKDKDGYGTYRAKLL